MYKIFFILFIFFIVLLITYILHLKAKKEKFKNLPSTVVYDIDHNIELPDIKWEKNIPKTIYRTHKSAEHCKDYQEVFDISNRNMKDYETIFYYQEDIDKFILEKFGKRIYNAYNAINPQFGPAKADFFRYLVIYYYGGIYLDIKSGAIKNIDKIVQDLKGRMAFSNWTKIPLGLIPIEHIDELHYSSFVDNYFGEYQNWYILSGKGNPILKLIIKQMVTNIEQGIKNKKGYNDGRNSVLVLTGPVMMTKVIDKNINSKYVKFFNPNLDGSLKYKIVNHKKIEKNNYYRNITNKNVLL